MLSAVGRAPLKVAVPTESVMLGSVRPRYTSVFSFVARLDLQQALARVARSQSGSTSIGANGSAIARRCLSAKQSIETSRIACLI